MRSERLQPRRTGYGATSPRLVAAETEDMRFPRRPDHGASALQVALLAALVFLGVLLAWSYIAVALITLGVAFLALGAAASVGTALIVVGVVTLLLAMGA